MASRSAAWPRMGEGATGASFRAARASAAAITGSAPTSTASGFSPGSLAKARQRRPETRNNRQSRRRRQQAGSRAKARSRAWPSAARTSASLIGVCVAADHSRAVTPSKLVFSARSPTRSPAMINSHPLAVHMASEPFPPPPRRPARWPVCSEWSCPNSSFVAPHKGWPWFSRRSTLIKLINMENSEPLYLSPARPRPSSRSPPPRSMPM